MSIDKEVFQCYGKNQDSCLKSFYRESNLKKKKSREHLLKYQ